MADLPKYQSSAVFSDVPTLDFANVRESFKRSQSLSSSLDRLSEFAGKKALEERKKEAEQYTVDNPPTPEQLQKAKEGTFDPNELVPGGGTFFRETVRKLQGDQLKNVLNVETQNDYMQILNDVKERRIVSDEELKIKLEAPIIGRSKTLAQIDPEAALSYNALAAANGFQIRKAANEQFELNAKLEYDELTSQSVESGLPLIREIVKQAGTTDPQAVKDQVEAIYGPIKRLAENGTTKSKEYLKQVEDELEGIAITGLDKTRMSAVRLAATGDKRAEVALSIALKEMDNYANAFGVNPKVREKYLNDTIEDFHVSRIQAEFAATPNKQAYLNNLRKDMTKGPVGELFDANGNPTKTNRVSRGVELPKLESMINGFEADIRANEARVTSLRAELKSDITEANRILSLGSTVSQTTISELSQRARNLGISANDDVTQRINTLSLLNQDTISFQKMSPIQLRDVQRRWEQETKGGANLQQAERLNNIRNYAASYEDSLKKDPVAAMNKSGVPVETLDFSLPDKDFISKAQQRMTDAKVFADRNGIKPQFLSNDEANSIATFLQNGSTDQQIGMITKLTNSFGKNAPKVLSEVSKFAPEYAHIGGLAISGVSRTTVQDALNGIKQKQAGNSPFAAGKDAASKREAMAESLGNAFFNSPNTRQNIVTVADSIYTQRAILKGVTDFNPDLYKDAFQEAAGAVKGKNNKWYGGIISYKGMNIPIPNNIEQDNFDDIIGKATYEDFQAAANGPLVDARGVKYSIKNLRNAYIASVNTDEGALYYNDYRTSEAPIQFYTQDGSPAIINFRTLANRVKTK